MRYRVSDLADLNIRSVSKNAKGVIYYIDTSSVFQGHFREANRYSAIADAPSRARRLAQEGDTVISMVRPSNEHIGFIDFDTDNYVFSTGFVVVHPNSEIVEPFYLYLLLSLDSTTRYLQQIAETSTTAYPSVKVEDIGNLSFDIPEISKQRKIVHKIRIIEQKIKLNQEINDNLLDVAQLIFNSMFPNVNYGTQTIGELTRNFDKLRKPLSKKQRIEIQGNYRYIGATSVNDYISKYNFDGIYLLLAEDGSVQDNNGFPILQYVFGKFWPNNHTHVLQGNNISTEWLYLFFRQHKVSELVTGAVQPKISQSNLNKISITAPTEEEKEIFSTRTDNIFSLIRQNELQNTNLLMLKNLLLSKYF
ncbi:restriction endonuclease subunit S [Lactobacillus delbrueckii]|uniref:restriction endonuclease subunit S n=1 Tax=Lactobacillus delbrueckii TaxID=1584 RepID=UPI001F281B51|nr:restriction endonuclease subunit S [Lactobacillus delbrueckii]GHN35700.1 hypothetical protein ME792_08260 [Lactobacillus delbrueckii]